MEAKDLPYALLRLRIGSALLDHICSFSPLCDANGVQVGAYWARHKLYLHAKHQSNQTDKQGEGKWQVRGKSHLPWPLLGLMMMVTLLGWL